MTKERGTERPGPSSCPKCLKPHSRLCRKCADGSWLSHGPGPGLAGDVLSAPGDVFLCNSLPAPGDSYSGRRLWAVFGETGGPGARGSENSRCREPSGFPDGDVE